MTVPHGKFNGKKLFKKVCLGVFWDEEEAARVADKGRIGKCKTFLSK